MVVLGVGVGLFYSSITTAAVTALDPSRSSLAGGIVYMCQIAGGAIGLGLNTAIVASASIAGRRHQPRLQDRRRARGRRARRRARGHRPPRRSHPACVTSAPTTAPTPDTAATFA